MEIGRTIFGTELGFSKITFEQKTQKYLPLFTKYFMNHLDSISRLCLIGTVLARVDRVADSCLGLLSRPSFDMWIDPIFIVASLCLMPSKMYVGMEYFVLCT